MNTLLGPRLIHFDVLWALHHSIGSQAKYLQLIFTLKMVLPVTSILSQKPSPIPPKSSQLFLLCASQYLRHLVHSKVTISLPECLPIWKLVEGSEYAPCYILTLQHTE